MRQSILSHSRRAAFAIIASAATVMATLGGAVADSPSDSDRCAAKIDGKWSLAERFVWTRICLGQTADFNHAKDFGGELAADKEQGWAAANRDVGAKFLQEVLSQKKYLDDIPQKTISIDGSRFLNSSKTYISALNVYSIEIMNSRFDGVFVFNFANVENLFYIGKSVINELSFDELTAKNITVYDSQIDKMEIRNSHVSAMIGLEGIDSNSVSLSGGRIGSIAIVRARHISSVAVSQCTVGGMLDSLMAVI
jgi:hypothetical protein